MRRRILFLMSDTGGGHRAAAQAIGEAVHHLYPDQFDVVIEDIWIQHTRWPINRMPGAYPWLSSSGTRWWQMVWTLSARRRLRQGMLKTASVLTSRGIVRYLRATRPDVVVSVHPAMNHLGVRWVRRAGLPAPFYTVITDMVTVHPLWICPDVTGCAVSTEPARQQALALGMPAHKLTVCGQPVGLRFAQLTGEKEELRRRLGLANGRSAVLIVGGGEGIGRVYDIARAVAQQAPTAQLILVAGRNKALRQKLAETAWEIPVQVHGFVHNMPELMAAADLLITKAGPGTISEAFIAGLPLILSGYIPGQEAGNVQYVLENDAGAYAEDPADIAALVRSWLAPGSDRLPHLAQQAARLARPHAALDLARFLTQREGVAPIPQ
ncbi:MAG: glycosyltransferase [Anaerolineales bacterium]|nr:glycosyltransferase [Anaerolineales bacterium]